MNDVLLKKNIVYKNTSIAELYIRDKTKNANFFFKAFKVG